MKRTIDVCDTCEDMRREVKTYEVKSGSTKVSKVLCAVHARPLEVLLGNAKPAGRPPAKKAASRVTTLSDIEKGKTTKKAAAK